MLYGTHHHKCNNCGWISDACWVMQGCNKNAFVSSCQECEHLWKKNLRVMARMLAGEIKLPHSIGQCSECGKARLMQINYQEELQSRIPNFKEHIKHLSQSINAGATRITVDGVSYVWSTKLNQWISESQLC